jgi:hypothetical protein
MCFYVSIQTMNKFNFRINNFLYFQLGENAQLIVTELKDHVIIQEDGENVLGLAEENISGEEMDHIVVDGQVRKNIIDNDIFS